jgi:hypothetical protein
MRANVFAALSSSGHVQVKKMLSGIPLSVLSFQKLNRGSAASHGRDTADALR